ncbi:uncharacterized protein LOC127257923 [Andrographis paniculata]|uniref:uncharacterized protein LOC127257923 n=1 Tax=Andrographis paniculata TaxID=175694 RepID=UPI0021E89610|nr:uncharacterized protein LOC127257923 [Andrographis paniculata]XP_051140472.1 uncharacterized protein LOC127257923 [Andrographis paniculata]
MMKTKNGGEDDELDSGNGVELEIEKTGPYSLTVHSKIVVQASLQTVWDVLTDYERLPDFIPGLAVSRVVEKGDKYARVFQIGKQKLPFGLKFDAKATLDCFEKDIQMLPCGRKRDIEFKMIEGDFKRFEGKWIVIEQSSDTLVGGESQTTLEYIANGESKMWLPIRLVEGRMRNEIQINMSSLRKEAEKLFRNIQLA